MRAPDRSWHRVDSLNWLKVMGVNQRMESHPVVRVSGILMLALVPMLVALMTVPARSENSAEVGQVAEASENTSGEYRLAPGDRLEDRGVRSDRSFRGISLSTAPARSCCRSPGVSVSLG